MDEPEHHTPITAEEIAHAFEEEEAPVDLSVYSVEDWLALAVFWLMALCVFLQFFTRYVLNNSLASTEEIAINCLVNPEAVLIGGRLPAGIVDQIANRLNQRLASFTGTVPFIAPVARASMSDDAPAVGAAILPFSHRLLPTRTALMKVAAL